MGCNSPTLLMEIILPSLLPLRIDEKAWSLFEEDKLTPDHKESHRYQTIRVFRNGNLVEFETDMGSSVLFKTEPFYIPSYTAHSVGQVLEYADLLRRDGTGLQRALDDHREEANLMEAYIENTEILAQFVKRNPRTTADMLKRNKERLSKHG